MSRGTYNRTFKKLISKYETEFTYHHSIWTSVKLTFNNPSLYEKHSHDYGKPWQKVEGCAAGHSVDHGVLVHHLRVKGKFIYFQFLPFTLCEILCKWQVAFLATQPVWKRPILEEVEEGRGGRRGDDPEGEDVALVAPRGPRQRLLVGGRVAHGPGPVRGQSEQQEGVYRGADLSISKENSELQVHCAW